MRIIRSTILSVIIPLALCGNIFAQGSFNVHGGAAIPLNNFYLYQINYDKSSASLGWNIGMQYSYRFSNKNFGVFGGIDYIHNDVNKGFKETVEYWDSRLTSEQSVFPTYTNVPITFGTNYTYRVSDFVSLSCDLGLSINFLFISEFKAHLYEGETEMANGLGGCFGINMTLKDRYSFNVNYKGLGKHSVDGFSESGFLGDLEEFSQELSIHLLTLTLGLSF